MWNRSFNDNEQKNKKKHGKLRSVFNALRYADNMDSFILIFSIFFAIGGGFYTSLSMYYLLAPVMSTFIKAETPGNPYNVDMTAEIPQLKLTGYGFLVIGVLHLTTSMLQIIGSEIASRNIVAKIKTAYLSKILCREVGLHEKSEERLGSSVSQDLQNIKVLFDSDMTNAAEMFSAFFVGCIAGIIVSWKVALLALGSMLIAVLFMFFVQQASRNRGKLWQQYTRKCTKITSEVLGNVRTVAAYGGEYKEIERYKSTLKVANMFGFKQATMISAAKALGYFQSCICYMIAYYYTASLYLEGEFDDPGYLVIILSAQVNALHKCPYMLKAIYDLNLAAGSAQRVMSFLDTENSCDKSVEHGLEPDTFRADLSFKNVHFSYPKNLDTKILHDLRLDVKAGKVTAVVGTSGAGKSTIVNLITRLYDVTGGEILVGGVDIKNLNVSWLRDQIAVVGQEPVLFDTSIEENIRYGKTTATMEEIIEAAKISNAHSLIEKLSSGYGTIVGEKGTKLSIDQKQRIAIARAIVKNPKLLLLDEATSALDVHSEGIVKESLDNAMRGRTTLIFAQSISTVQKAHVIYALKGGSIVEKGTHSELMGQKGYYYSLAKTQELEEKDKVVALYQRSIPKEEFIEEATPVVEDNLEDNKFLQLSKENLKLTVLWFLSILFSATSSIHFSAVYYIYSLLHQSFTYSKDELRSIAVIDAGYLFGLGTITFFSVTLCGVMSTIATQKWLERLQKNTFKKIVSMDMSWFDRSGNSPNQCLEKLTKSPQLIESVTKERAGQFPIFIFSLLFTIGFASFFSPIVALMYLPLFLIYIITICLNIKSRNSDELSATLTNGLTKVAAQYIHNVITIQVLNCQKYVINRYHDTLVRSKKEAIVGIFWSAAVSSFTKTLVRFAMGVLFICGTNVIVSGNIKGTTLISLMFAQSTVSALAVPALMLIIQVPAAKEALKKLHSIANTKTSLNTLSKEGNKPEIKGHIVFQDIVFSYPARQEVQVLKQLNLEIEAGKTVALVGDSVHGPSIIISLLERFYLPNEGKILIDGNDINDINVRYLKSQMSLVSREPVLFDMTIKENILYGLNEEVTMEKIVEAAKIAKIHNFITELPQAYDTPVGENGSKLSEGQKQKIVIARAVLRNPKILLLDEATSALDKETEKDVQEALDNASIGRTCIVMAHRLSTIRKADKIVVLQSGVVVEEGNHEQLIERRGHYYNLLHR